MTGYGIFLELDHCFLFLFWHGTRNPYEGGRDSSGFFGKMFLPPKLGKCAKTWQKIGFFEFIKEYGS